MRASERERERERGRKGERVSGSRIRSRLTSKDREHEIGRTCRRKWKAEFDATYGIMYCIMTENEIEAAE